MSSALDLLSLAALDDGDHDEKRGDAGDGAASEHAQSHAIQPSVTVDRSAAEDNAKSEQEDANPRVSGVKRKASTSSLNAGPATAGSAADYHHHQHTSSSGPAGLPPSLASILSQSPGTKSDGLPLHHPPPPPPSNGNASQHQQQQHQYQPGAVDQPFPAVDDALAAAAAVAGASIVAGTHWAEALPTPLPEDSGIIRCICGYEDDDGFTIQCEKCFAWQHALCVNISPEDVPDEFICPQCSAAALAATLGPHSRKKVGPTKQDRDRARELQRFRKEAEARLRKQRLAMGYQPIPPTADSTGEGISAADAAQEDEYELLAQARGLAAQQQSRKYGLSTSTAAGKLAATTGENSVETGTDKQQGNRRNKSGSPAVQQLPNRSSSNPAALDKHLILTGGTGAGTQAASIPPAAAASGGGGQPLRKRKSGQQQSATNTSADETVTRDRAGLGDTAGQQTAQGAPSNAGSSRASGQPRKRRSGVGAAATVTATATAAASAASKAERSNPQASAGANSLANSVGSDALPQSANAAHFGKADGVLGARSHDGSIGPMDPPPPPRPSRPKMAASQSASGQAAASATAGPSHSLNAAVGISESVDLGERGAGEGLPTPTNLRDGFLSSDDDSGFDERYEPWQFEYTSTSTLRWSDKAALRRTKQAMLDYIAEDKENFEPPPSAAATESMSVDTLAYAAGPDGSEVNGKGPISHISATPSGTNSAAGSVSGRLGPIRPSLLSNVSFLSSHLALASASRNESPVPSSGSSTPAYSATGVASALACPQTPIFVGGSTFHHQGLPESAKLSVKPIATTSLSLAPPACAPFSAPSCVPSLMNPYPRPTIHAVFATSSHPAGAFITLMHGEILSGERYRSDPLSQWADVGVMKQYTRGISQPWDLVLDQRKWGDDTRFIRQGCHPNVYVRPIILHRSSDASRQSPESKLANPAAANTNGLNGKTAVPSSSSSRRTRKNRKGVSTNENTDTDGEGATESWEFAVGLFALQDIAKREELVLPFDWADDHVIHTLHTLLFSPSLSFPVLPANMHLGDTDTSDDDGIPSTSSKAVLTVAQRAAISKASERLYGLSRLASRTCVTLLGNTVCACEKRRDCAIFWLWKLASFSETSGRNKSGLVRLEDFDLKGLKIACGTALASDEKEGGYGGTTRSSKKAGRKRRADIGALVGLPRGWVQGPVQQEHPADPDVDERMLGDTSAADEAKEDQLELPEETSGPSESATAPSQSLPRSISPRLAAAEKQDLDTSMEDSQAPAAEDVEMAPAATPAEADMLMPTPTSNAAVGGVGSRESNPFDLSSNIPPFLQTLMHQSRPHMSLIDSVHHDHPEREGSSQRSADDSGNESDLTEPLQSGSELSSPKRKGRTPAKAAARRKLKEGGSGQGDAETRVEKHPGAPKEREAPSVSSKSAGILQDADANADSKKTLMTKGAPAKGNVTSAPAAAAFTSRKSRAPKEKPQRRAVKSRGIEDDDDDAEGEAAAAAAPQPLSKVGSPPKREQSPKKSAAPSLPNVTAAVPTFVADSEPRLRVATNAPPGPALDALFDAQLPPSPVRQASGVRADATGENPLTGKNPVMGENSEEGVSSAMDVDARENAASAASESIATSNIDAGAALKLYSENGARQDDSAQAIDADQLSASAQEPKPNESRETPMPPPPPPAAPVRKLSFKAYKERSLGGAPLKGATAETIPEEPPTPLSSATTDEASAQAAQEDTGPPAKVEQITPIPQVSVDVGVGVAQEDGTPAQANAAAVDLETVNEPSKAAEDAAAMPPPPPPAAPRARLSFRAYRERLGTGPPGLVTPPAVSAPLPPLMDLDPWSSASVTSLPLTATPVQEEPPVTPTHSSSREQEPESEPQRPPSPFLAAAMGPTDQQGVETGSAGAAGTTNGSDRPIKTSHTVHSQPLAEPSASEAHPSTPAPANESADTARIGEAAEESEEEGEVVASVPEEAEHESETIQKPPYELDLDGSDRARAVPPSNRTSTTGQSGARTSESAAEIAGSQGPQASISSGRAASFGSSSASQQAFSPPTRTTSLARSNQGSPPSGPRNALPPTGPRNPVAPPPAPWSRGRGFGNHPSGRGGAGGRGDQKIHGGGFGSSGSGGSSYRPTGGPPPSAPRAEREGGGGPNPAGPAGGNERGGGGAHHHGGRGGYGRGGYRGRGGGGRYDGIPSGPRDNGWNRGRGRGGLGRGNWS